MRVAADDIDYLPTTFDSLHASNVPVTGRWRRRLNPAANAQAVQAVVTAAATLALFLYPACAASHSPPKTSSVDGVLLACAIVIFLEATARLMATALPYSLASLRVWVGIFTSFSLALDISFIAGAWAVRARAPFFLLTSSSSPPPLRPPARRSWCAARAHPRDPCVALRLPPAPVLFAGAPDALEDPHRHPGGPRGARHQVFQKRPQLAPGGAESSPALPSHPLPPSRRCCQNALTRSPPAPRQNNWTAHVRFPDARVLTSRLFDSTMLKIYLLVVVSAMIAAPYLQFDSGKMDEVASAMAAIDAVGQGTVQADRLGLFNGTGLYETTATLFAARVVVLCSVADAAGPAVRSGSSEAPRPAIPPSPLVVRAEPWFPAPGPSPPGSQS